MTAIEERFAGGTAVVTGGGSGIGEGICVKLGRSGMNVVVADRDTDRAEAVAKAIREAGGRAEGRTLDVTDEDACVALAGDLYETYEGVDLLFNNAGVETAGMVWELSPRRWRQVMDVNVQGVINGIHAFVPRMIEAGKPAVVANTASVGGIGISPFQGPYIVSKHAVVALTECLYQELRLVGESSIQVSVVLPFWVKTRIFEDAQAAAPTDNPMANAFFAYMQDQADAIALTPQEAGEVIVQGVADGDFWVFTHREEGIVFLKDRAAQFDAQQTPPVPTDRMRELGVLQRG